ncbi:glycosyl hydrolase family 17 protein [Hydrogenophaga sp.]|uniref:glycosyl hydrolase family 17 protein n=1 Tax=Hydrogenophaga sp. TaxID=1904254 RepID=UPI0025B7E4D8|nr:glycosyl hydrolase family 17 protein [Hydrogenophaga sp.]
MRTHSTKSSAPLTQPMFSLRRARSGIAVLLVAMLAACGGGGEITVDPPASAVAVTNPRALPAEYLARQAVAYGPYRTSASGADLANEVIPPANIKQDMDLLVAGNFRLIRIFDSGDKVAKQTLDVIVDNNIDMKLQLGAFMGGFKFEPNPNKVEDIKAANLRELDRAIALANDPKYRDVILTVSVGNENIVDFSADRIDPADMAVYIKYVRDRVTQPVTTDDNFQVFSNPIPKAVLDQIDFVAIHAYPVIDTEFPNSSLYWDWKQLSVPAGPARATAMMDASIVELKKQFQATRDALNSVGLSRMPIAITETGWKARITGNQAFRAHPVNQKMYFQRLETWRQESRLSGMGPVNIFYFEAFDEPWKLSDDGWGLFNKDRQARYVIQNLYPQNIWENATLTDADAVYFVPPTINPAFAGNAFTLYSDAPGASLIAGYNLDAFDGFTAPRNLADTTIAAAPGDGAVSMRITPAPAGYGWGLLYNPQTGGTTQNLSAFSAVNVWINTFYEGRIEIGVSTLDVDGNGQEAFVQIGNGQYGYCNTGAWCRVSIPLQAFLAVNPRLDFRLVVNPFYIADRYSFTGKTSGADIRTPLNIDGISWTR